MAGYDTDMAAYAEGLAYPETAEVDETVHLHQQLRQRQEQYHSHREMTRAALHKAIALHDQKIKELQKMEAAAQEMMRGLR